MYMYLLITDFNDIQDQIEQQHQNMCCTTISHKIIKQNLEILRVVWKEAIH